LTGRFTGETASRPADDVKRSPVSFLENGCAVVHGVWLTPQDAVTMLLLFLGENPFRAGLTDTPRRYLRALEEMARAAPGDGRDIIGDLFPGGVQQTAVIVRDIAFASVCEHHLLPFSGRAHVCYHPNDAGEVIGLSKLPRLVEHFSRRLQLQERLGQQIAEAIMTHGRAAGVCVVLEAAHTCTACRGVKKPEATTQSVTFLGTLPMPVVDSLLR
jgi:GTP cyclohydrolase I